MSDKRRGTIFHSSSRKLARHDRKLEATSIITDALNATQFPAKLTDVTRASSVTSGACLCILFAVQEHRIRRTKREQLCELEVDSDSANHDRAIKEKRAKKEAL